MCVGANTIITTENGARRITEDSLLQTRVLSGDGKFNRVLHRTKRNVDYYYDIHTQKGTPITVSAEHPFFATKASRFMLHKHPTDEWLQWMRADTLEKGDFVAIPIPKENDKLPLIDLTLFDSSLEHDENFVWYKMGFSSKRAMSYTWIIREARTTKSVVESVIKNLRANEKMRGHEQKRVCAFLSKHNYEVPKPKKYPRFIQVDNDLLWLFGWYLAEGSGSNGAIEFSLGKLDLPHVKRIMNVFEDKFGECPHIIMKEKSLRLLISGQIYEVFFKKWFGDGAENKKIPRELMKCVEKLYPLAEAAFLGDGCIVERRGRAGATGSIALISKDAIHQLWVIFLANKILGSIRTVPNNRGFKGKDKAYKLLFSGKSFYRFAQLAKLDITLPKRMGASEIFLEKYVLVPIRNIVRIEKKATLYDIEVEGEHSFVGNGLLLHNTLPEAMAHGRVVVGSTGTGSSMLIENGKNGFTFQPRDVDALVDILKNLKENFDDLKYVAKEARKTASEYTWEKVKNRYRELYTEILK